MYDGDGDDGGDGERPGLEPADGGVDPSVPQPLGAATAPRRTPAALREELIRLRRVIDRLELQFSSVAAAFAATEEKEWQGHVSPIQWIRNQCGMTAAAAWKAICVGDQAPALPHSIKAVSEVRIGFAHLAVLAGTARALRESPTAAGFDEKPLLDNAVAHTLNRFRDDCAHVRHAHDAQAFLAEQAEDVEFRTLDARTGEEGVEFLNGYFDRVGGATIRAALDVLARPAGNHDARSRGRRYADSLVELAERCLDAGALPRVAGQRPHLHVTTTVETLAGTPGAPAGVLDGAGPIAGATVRRLACDASVTRVVMSPDSVVLDVGRTRRLPSVPTRRALYARESGCVWPGCDRTAGWTAAHHITHWAQGGATELDNLVLICHRHHWLVHEGGWKLVRREDGQMLAIAPVAEVAWRARPPDDTPIR
jgi:Domain of unknown function (DUF222)/HNH endonuclease